MPRCFEVYIHRFKVRSELIWVGFCCRPERRTPCSGTPDARCAVRVPERHTPVCLAPSTAYAAAISVGIAGRACEEMWAAAQAHAGTGPGVEAVRNRLLAETGTEWATVLCLKAPSKPSVSLVARTMSRPARSFVAD